MDSAVCFSVLIPVIANKGVGMYSKLFVLTCVTCIIYRIFGDSRIIDFHNLDHIIIHCNNNKNG